MPTLRCCACQNEWDTPAARGVTPKCPGCGAGPAVIAPVECVHFDPPSGTPGRGVNVAACNPKLRVGPGCRATGEPDAVTCKACKATEIYRTADGPGCLPLRAGKLPG